MGKYSNLPLLKIGEKWEQATLVAQRKAGQRLAVISPILNELKKGRNITQSFEIIAIADKDKSTIRRHIKSYQKSGISGLLANHKGRELQAQEWHALASDLYLQSSSPSRASVAKKMLYSNEFMLIDKGVSESKITNYLKKTHPKNAPERVGKHNHRLNHGTYTRVDEPLIKAGDEYQGDGHTIDLYLAHHNSGKPFRYEFTVWLDVVSRYIVGYALSNAESAHTTLESLSNALITHNHLPLTLHIDNGAGFVNKMLNEKSTGFYDRLGVSIKRAHPGNSKGKGKVERWFRTFEMQLSAIIATGFCGRGHDAKTKLDWHRAANKHQSPIRTVADFKQFLSQYLDQYHRTPHRGEGMNNQTPAAVWATREQRDLDVPHDYFLWVQKACVVQKGAVRINNREDVSTLLVPFNSEKVVVEYALNSDDFVRIFNADGTRFITQAELAKRKQGLTLSLLEDKQNKQKRAKLVRLEHQTQRVEQEYRPALEHQTQAQLVAKDGGIRLDLNVKSSAKSEIIKLDI